MRTKGKRLTRKEAEKLNLFEVEVRCMIKTGWKRSTPDLQMSFTGKVTRVRSIFGHIEVCIGAVCGPISNIKSWSTMKQWKKDNAN